MIWSTSCHLSLFLAFFLHIYGESFEESFCIYNGETNSSPLCFPVPLNEWNPVNVAYDLSNAKVGDCSWTQVEGKHDNVKTKWFSQKQTPAGWILRFLRVQVQPSSACYGCSPEVETRTGELSHHDLSLLRAARVLAAVGMEQEWGVSGQWWVYEKLRQVANQ